MWSFVFVNKKTFKEEFIIFYICMQWTVKWSQSFQWSIIHFVSVTDTIHIVITPSSGVIKKSDNFWCGQIDNPQNLYILLSVESLKTDNRFRQQYLEQLISKRAEEITSSQVPYTQKSIHQH